MYDYFIQEDSSSEAEHVFPCNKIQVQSLSFPVKVCFFVAGPGKTLEEQLQGRMHSSEL